MALVLAKSHIPSPLASIRIARGPPVSPPIPRFAVPRTHGEPQEAPWGSPAARRSGVALCAFTSGSRRGSSAYPKRMRMDAGHRPVRRQLFFPLNDNENSRRILLTLLLLSMPEMSLLLAGPERSPGGAERRACQQQRAADRRPLS